MTLTEARYKLQNVIGEIKADGFKVELIARLSTIPDINKSFDATGTTSIFEKSWELEMDIISKHDNDSDG